VLNLLLPLGAQYDSFTSMAFDWTYFSYIGLVFAIVYRIPQILKLRRTRSGDDLSSATFLVHNGAYVSFILYLWGSGRTEPVLMFYYCMGISQNLLIFFMKRWYARQDSGRVAPEAELELEPLQAAAADGRTSPPAWEPNNADVRICEMNASTKMRGLTGGTTWETAASYGDRRRFFFEQRQVAQRRRAAPASRGSSSPRLGRAESN